MDMGRLGLFKARKLRARGGCRKGLSSHTLERKERELARSREDLRGA